MDQRPTRDDSVEFERLVADVSGRFLRSEPDAIDVEIERVFAAVGDVMGVDRCFTFLVIPGGAQHRARHVWTAASIDPDPEVASAIMQEACPWVELKRSHEKIVGDSEVVKLMLAQAEQYAQDMPVNPGDTMN